MPLYEDLKNRLNSNDFTAGIIGLGYVGLPLMHSMCSKGIRVLGFDIDPAKAEILNKGESYLDTVSSESVKKWRDASLFEATADMARLSEPDFIIICVPTPLTENREPDLSYVESTAKTIAKSLRSGQVISLESTTYPGTMDEVVKPILEQSGLNAETDFYLAYSPEREDPGNKNFHTASIPKVIGADSQDALGIATDFYSRFIENIVPVSSSRTAEAVKLTENIFRAVNIALVNELKVIYDRMGIDIWEVIDAAKTKPFGYMPFYPGPGLGGHCIPIDPFYLTWKAKEYGVPTKFIELAGEINHSMPQYVCDKTKEALDGGLKEKSLLVIGVAYKKDVNDQRESPAFPLIELFEAGGAKVDFHDPLIPEILPTRHHPALAGRKSVAIDADTLKSYDAVVLITDHSITDYNMIAENAQMIIDTRNVIDNAKNLVKA